MSFYDKLTLLLFILSVFVLNVVFLDIYSDNYYKLLKWLWKKEGFYNHLLKLKK